MSLKVYLLKPRKDLEISVCVSDNDAEVFEKVLTGLIDCKRIVDTFLDDAKEKTTKTPKKIFEAAEAAESALKKAEKKPLFTRIKKAIGVASCLMFIGCQEYEYKVKVTFCDNRQETIVTVRHYFNDEPTYTDIINDRKALTQWRDFLNVCDIQTLETNILPER